jgi:catalase
LASRPRKVKVGRLAITSAAPADTPGDYEREIFDPLLLPKGIELSNDPILLVRSEAYTISLSRRLVP